MTSQQPFEGATARTDVEAGMAGKVTHPGDLLTRCRETDYMRVASAQCCC